MVKVEKTGYGFKLILEGMVEPADLMQVQPAVQKAIAGREDGFSVLIDFRNAALLGPEAQEVTKGLIEGVKGAGGLQRSAVVLSSALAKIQTRRLSTESGVSTTERYIDAGKHLNWEGLALDWIERGIEPPRG